MHKINLINNKKPYNIFHYTYALLAFFSMSPYYVWSTYRSGIMSSLPQLLGVLSIAIMFFNLLKGKKLTSKYLLVGISIFAIGIYQRFIGMNFDSIVAVIKAIASIITISLFFFIDEVDRYKIYSIFVRIFALSLVSSIIVWAIINIGIDLPYKILETSQEGKVSLGRFYQHYPGAIFLANSSGIYNRLSGVFDEPGVIGTFSALFLAAEKFEFKNKWYTKLILIAGITSFSLAFYILMLVGISVKYYKRGVKKFLFIMIIVILILFVIVNIEIDNPFFKEYIQDRIFTENSIIVSNRTKRTFDSEFNKFLKSSSLEVIFGNGHEASKSNPLLRGASSYKMLIYDYGFFGFILLILWLVITSMRLNKFNKDYLILLSVFLVSIYQRPYIFNEYYLVVLFGGYASIKMINYNNIKNDMRLYEQLNVDEASNIKEQHI